MLPQSSAKGKHNKSECKQHQDKICDTCGKKSHIKMNCWSKGKGDDKKGGKPKHKTKVKGNNKNHGKLCYHCKFKGHSTAECRKKKAAEAE